MSIPKTSPDLSPKSPGLARVARRLKAARWLLGTEMNSKGRPIGLDVEDVAKLPGVRANGISASRLEEIEQARVPTLRPWEVQGLAVALGFPENWLLQEEIPGLTAERGTPILDAIQENRAIIGQLVDRLERLEQRAEQFQRILSPPPSQRAAEAIDQVERRLADAQGSEGGEGPQRLPGAAQQD